ncbi:carboxymuconolactone decarboxylase family protein [Actinoplanes sp. NPDC051475]|uniref:carboxymuconolactone decarboxylase family protein n=1 Tax=Actinoplanes sp. NPDC051475 TaxID=3157225 RepID=UPI00344B99A3
MVVQRIASSVAARQVLHVTPVAPRGATGMVAEIYAQVEREFKIVLPPVLAHSPVPDLLAAMWMLMREPLVAPGAVDRLTKEAVASAVALANTCPFCVDMHSTGLYDLSCEQDAEAIAGDRIGDVSDPGVRAAARWARWAHLDGAAGDPPFPARQRAELVGVLVSYHYVTRMVNVFQPGYLLPSRLGPQARRRFKQGLSHVLAPVLRAEWPAGSSLRFLPAGMPLPSSAEWAEGHPDIAAAMARAYPVFEAAGERSVPPVVRQIVLGRLARWQGEEAEHGEDWCTGLIADLPPASRAAARLALLTAFASFRVDAGVIAEFRRHHPGDAALLDTTAWASFAAARQVGSRQLRTLGDARPEHRS